MKRTSSVGRFLGVVWLLAELGHPAWAVDRRINCGSTAYTAADGRVFQSDQAYTSGGYGYVTGSSDHSGIPVGGTVDQPLYWENRVDWQYRFDNMTPGAYLIELHFADFRKHGPALRIFDVDINGTEVLSNVDVFNVSGMNRFATRYRIPYTLTGTTLTIRGIPNVDHTFLSAIAVTVRSADAVAPAAPTGFAVTGGFEQNQLRWNDSPELDVAGYRVYRATSAGGTYTRLSPDPVRSVRYFDRLSSVGTTYFYRVTAVDAYGNESAPSTVISAVSKARSASGLPLYQIVLSQADWDILNEDPENDAVVPATFTGGGQNYNVEVRYRGGSTRTYAKKSWKVKFPTGSFQGRDVLNLNADMPDMTLLREESAYDFLHAVDVQGPLADHVQLFVNGDDYGVYVDVEDVDADFLDRVNLPPGGNLYRCFGDLSELADPDDYPLYYEKATNEGGSYDDLIAFISLINDTPANAFYDTIIGVFDVERFYRYYAANVLLGNIDFGLDDYYLYHDLVGDRWYWLPWDYNETFGLVQNWVDTVTVDMTIFPGGSNRLITRLRAVSHFRYRHLQQVQRWLDAPFTSSTMAADFTSEWNEIAESGRLDWFKWQWENNTRFDLAVSELNGFVSGRRSFLGTSVPPLVPAPLLVVNELVADNFTGATDEGSQHADWVEIYNPGSTFLNLTGYYLTDDYDNVRKWRFPAVGIPSHGYLVVWCDQDTLQGPLHANFKLNADGEVIGLFSPDADGNQPLDSMAFDDQLVDVAWGRYPDGTYNLGYLPTPTPGSANVAGGNFPPRIDDTAHTPLLPGDADTVRVTTRIWDDSGLTTTRLWVDAGAGIFPVQLFDNGASGDGAPGDSVYGGKIPPAPGGVTVHYYVEAIDNGGVMSRDPRTAPADTYFYTVNQVLPPVSVNEFLASNATTNQDEFGEYDDWVEIYNSGGAPINLTGMYLTDNFGQPRKWQFPAVTIPIGGFLLVWCDDQVAQGPLHTNFKLSQTGEQLGIFESIAHGNTPVDTLSFGPQTTDDSFGRYPDGSDNWVVFATPTPGGSNEVVDVTQTDSNRPLTVYLVQSSENPVRGHASLTFGTPQRARVDLTLYDLGGRRLRSLVSGAVLDVGHYRASWDGRDARGQVVAPGVYFFRLQVAKDVLTRKVVVAR